MIICNIYGDYNKYMVYKYLGSKVRVVQYYELNLTLNKMVL